MLWKDRKYRWGPYQKDFWSVKLSLLSLGA